MAITETDIRSGLGAETAKRVGPERTGGGECWQVEIGGSVFAAKFATSDFESERFERGKEVLERIRSDRVMKLESTGRLMCEDGDEYPYTLCEFVAGGNVREKLTESGSPSASGLRAFSRGLFEGLHALDENDVVHRDIKPENIMLRDGEWAAPVLVDFGYTKLMNQSALTVYPWAGGTAPYMSPEQLHGEPARVRSDIWSAVVVILEVANGCHPYKEVSNWLDASEILERIEKPPTLSSAVPEEVKRWASEVNDFRGYKRKRANAAIELMDAVWQ